MVLPPAEKKTHQCPQCGASPSILNEFWGRAFSAACSHCGWCGESRDVETSAQLAMQHWDDKCESYGIYPHSTGTQYEAIVMLPKILDDKISQRR